MTDPTGRSFLSYRRTRAKDAALLIQAQRDRGIPTWQDIDNLDYEQTESALDKTLRDESTANAILWITPDVDDSDVIKQTEAPAILKRALKSDPFFVVPAAAGKLDYAAASALLNPHLGVQQLKHWKMLCLPSDPLKRKEAVCVARAVLKHRIRAIHEALPPDVPLLMRFYTRDPAPVERGYALTVDWSSHFNPRRAKEATWAQSLLPALEDIVLALAAEANSRQVVACGLPALPAVIALGTAFMATRNRPIVWKQHIPGKPFQEWGLLGSTARSGFVVSKSPGEASGTDFAVLVSVNDNVEKDVAKLMPKLPPLRVIYHVHHRSGPNPREFSSAGQVRHVAGLVKQAIRTARNEYPVVQRLHLFMAVPAGLAMMVGQLLNTVSEVQTYEFMRKPGKAGRYVPAVVLYPSG